MYVSEHQPTVFDEGLFVVIVRKLNDILVSRQSKLSYLENSSLIAFNCPTYGTFNSKKNLVLLGEPVVAVTEGYDWKMGLLLES